MQKQVLVYGFGADEAAVLALMVQHGISPRVVAPEELDEKIGYLCGMEGFEVRNKPAGEPVEQATLLFRNIGREELGEVLDDLRKAAASVSAIKAMVTPTNTHWTFRHLCAEIGEEHRVMNALMQLQQYRETMSAPNPLNVKLMAAVARADDLIYGRVQPTVRAILEAQMALMEAEAEK